MLEPGPEQVLVRVLVLEQGPVLVVLEQERVLAVEQGRELVVERGLELAGVWCRLAILERVVGLLAVQVLAVQVMVGQQWAVLGLVWVWWALVSLHLAGQRRVAGLLALLVMAVQGLAVQGLVGQQWAVLVGQQWAALVGVLG